MFNAVETFCLSHSSENASLRRIRFTNWDKPTVDVFAKEFTKRYGIFRPKIIPKP